MEEPGGAHADGALGDRVWGWMWLLMVRLDDLEGFSNLSDSVKSQGELQ